MTKKCNTHTQRLLRTVHTQQLLRTAPTLIVTRHSHTECGLNEAIGETLKQEASPWSGCTPCLLCGLDELLCCLQHLSLVPFAPISANALSQKIKNKISALALARANVGPGKMPPRATAHVAHVRNCPCRSCDCKCVQLCTRLPTSRDWSNSSLLCHFAKSWAVSLPGYAKAHLVWFGNGHQQTRGLCLWLYRPQ